MSGASTAPAPARGRGALAADLARIDAILGAHAGGGAGPAPRATPAEDAAIDRLVAIFGLTDFERDIVLMCAAMELDAATAATIARVQDGGAPSFSLALAALPLAHWSALLPAAPLRHWQLVRLGEGTSLVGSPLRIDERILHYLLDLGYLDPRLGARVSLAAPPPPLVLSHAAIAQRMADLWLRAEQDSQPPPAIQLCGGDAGAQADIAAAACTRIGQPLLRIEARDLPDEPEALDRTLRLIDRETLLIDGALLVIADADPARGRTIDAVIDRATGPLVLAGAPRRVARTAAGARTPIAIEVERPAPAEQLAAWQLLLDAAGIAPPADLRTLAFQFDLDLSAIRAAGAEGLGVADGDVGAALWDSCRRRARDAIAAVVERIETTATWDDLVLPERERATVATIIDQVRHRATIHGDWGFSPRGRHGMGIAALFAGPSGTGKTLAAEVIARELRLDLYRIDLSQVVDKYIGETEKNLARVFDTAEAGGAILLFDEADALFGKRSEVKDSHDRHANIEVSYLLSRVERYSGLAILTTNLKDSIDPAFLRRLRFIVGFPFPDAPVREAIWQRAFPKAMPRDTLDYPRLAQLNLAGGAIRNIALNAAFLAAGRAGAVTMADIRAAAAAEYAKTGRSLTEAETRGWR